MASAYATATPTTTATKGRRFGRKRKSGASALMTNKMKEPGMKMIEWRAKSGERWAIARANLQEKMTHLGASMKLGFFTATHPVHPLRRQAAKELMKNKKIAATERKVQKVGAAHANAAAKRARAREGRVAQLNQAVH